MDKKLTDSEIVKALEEWIKNYDGLCVNFKTLGNVLDLINRLQAENKRLSTLAELGKTRANDYRVMRDRALKAEAENERLNNAIDEQDIEIAQLYKRLDKAKTEAYTDFAESLKKDFDNPHIQKFGLDFVKFLKNVVDNRLKKLGDDNA